MKKRLLSAFLASAMVLSLAACGGSQPAPQATQAAAPATEAAKPAEAKAEAPKQEAAAPAEDIKVVEVTICGTNGKGDTQSNAHERFAELLNETGHFKATAMVSSEMGSTDDVLEQALAGAGVVAATDPARLASYVPEFGILMMPYIFDSYDQLDGLLDTELYKQWTKDLDAQGMTLLTNNCLTGFRMYVTNKEINKPEDLNGLKIRTMGSAIAVNSINAMGAIATSLNQSEAYNAIQTGVVAGGEWQVPTIYSLRMFEVCKNISLTKHFLLTASIVCGSSWFNQLSDVQKQEMKDCAVKAYGETKAAVIQAEKDYLAEMESQYGVKITEPDIEAFKEATKHLYSDPATTGGADYNAIREELYKQMGITK